MFNDFFKKYITYDYKIVFKAKNFKITEKKDNLEVEYG